MSESVVERLMKTNPHMEVWWDSSLLVYEPWMRSTTAAAPAGKRDELTAQLGRLFNVADPAASVMRGCTTNPPLSLAAVKSNPTFWNARIAEIAAEEPSGDPKRVAWVIYKDVIRRGAAMIQPLYEASNRRYGWVSGQLDPRLMTEKETM